MQYAYPNPTVLTEEVVTESRYVQPIKTAGLPMCEELQVSKFYVRDCYPTYYDYIAKIMLTKEEYDTVCSLLVIDENGNPSKKPKVPGGSLLVIDENGNPSEKPKVRLLTITGTPGIGKSIFYIYFFERFRKAHPTETIVTASFSDGELLECVVYYPNGNTEEHDTKIPIIKGSIHLYDGPAKHPPVKARMICFIGIYGLFIFKQ